jgi:hypothetical protein
MLEKLKARDLMERRKSCKPDNEEVCRPRKQLKDRPCVDLRESKIKLK